MVLDAATEVLGSFPDMREWLFILNQCVNVSVR